METTVLEQQFKTKEIKTQWQHQHILMCFSFCFLILQMQWNGFWRKRLIVIFLCWYLCILFLLCYNCRVLNEPEFTQWFFSKTSLNWKFINVFEWVIQDCIIFSHYYSFLYVWISAREERANAKQEQNWFLLRCLQNKQSLGFNWNLIQSSIWVPQMVPVEDESLLP